MYFPSVKSLIPLLPLLISLVDCGPLIPSIPSRDLTKDVVARQNRNGQALPSSPNVTRTLTINLNNDFKPLKKGSKWVFKTTYHYYLDPSSGKPNMTGITSDPVANKEEVMYFWNIAFGEAPAVQQVVIDTQGYWDYVISAKKPTLEVSFSLWFRETFSAHGSIINSHNPDYDFELWTDQNGESIPQGYYNFTWN